MKRLMRTFWVVVLVVVFGFGARSFAIGGEAEMPELDVRVMRAEANMPKVDEMPESDVQRAEAEAVFVPGECFAEAEIPRTERALKADGIVDKVEEPESHGPANRGLFVFLGSGTESSGASKSALADAAPDAIATELLIALAQQAGPLIASGKALRVVLTNNWRAQANEKFSNLWDEYRRRNFAASKNTKIAITKYTELKASHFDLNDWIIKEIKGTSLYLCIPHTYLIKLGVEADAVEAEVFDGVAPTELVLGLMVNHMKTVYAVDDIGIDKSADFAEALQPNNIFCEHSTYQTHQNQEEPTWSLFMVGHGLKGRTIVAMSIERFKEVLNYFAHSIKTRLLVYSSCFAGGENIQKAFSEEDAPLQAAYPYTDSFSILYRCPFDGA